MSVLGITNAVLLFAGPRKDFFPLSPTASRLATWSVGALVRCVFHAFEQRRRTKNIGIARCQCSLGPDVARKACEDDHVLVFAEPCRPDTPDYEVRLSCGKQNTELVEFMG
jgi:hypothetical protein